MGIWYSEEGPGWAVAPPSPLPAVIPNTIRMRLTYISFVIKKDRIFHFDKMSTWAKKLNTN